MPSEIAVTGINISIKGQKITLTPEEARKLKDELVGLLEVRMYPPVVINHPYVPVLNPPWPRWEITCGGIGAGISGFSEMQKLT